MSKRDISFETFKADRRALESASNTFGAFCAPLLGVGFVGSLLRSVLVAGVIDHGVLLNLLPFEGDIELISIAFMFVGLAVTVGHQSRWKRAATGFIASLN